MHITGKSFIVTGGASGLGRAAVEAIIAAGGRAVVLDVNAETGQAAEQALGSAAGRARLFPAAVAEGPAPFQSVYARRSGTVDPGSIAFAHTTAPSVAPVAADGDDTRSPRGRGERVGPNPPLVPGAPAAVIRRPRKRVLPGGVRLGGSGGRARGEGSSRGAHLERHGAAERRGGPAYGSTAGCPAGQHGGCQCQ